MSLLSLYVQGEYYIYIYSYYIYIYNNYIQSHTHCMHDLFKHIHTAYVTYLILSN